MFCYFIIIVCPVDFLTVYILIGAEHILDATNEEKVDSLGWGMVYVTKVLTHCGEITA